jgi:hypothetical protein
MKNLHLAFATLTTAALIGCQESSTSPGIIDDQIQNAAQNAAAVNTQLAPDFQSAPTGRVEGTISSINLTTGTVTIRGRIISTNAATKIERNGKHVRLSALRVGDSGQARLIGTSLLASKLEARGL